MVPNGWEVARLEDIASKAKYSMVDGPFGSNLKSEHYREAGVPVLQSGFVTSGWFKAKKYVYVEQQLFEEQKRSSAKAGDILMAKIGAQAGRCGVIPDGHPVSIIAGNCLKLSFDDEITSTQYMHTALSWEYERTGLVEIKTETAQPAISLKSLKSFRMILPPLPEQRKIALILSTWDKAIATTEKLIETSKQQKKALMQQLLTGKKRLVNPETGKVFEGDWKKVELGKLLDYKQPTPYLVKSTEYSNEYPTPVLTAGKTFILGYSNEDFGIFREELPAIIFDDFTTASKFVDFPFKAKSSAMKILIAKDGVSIKYVYEAMQVLNYPVGGHQRHWISIFANLVIGLPEPEEQQKIASVLTAADKEIEILEAKLTHFKQEKKALMQQLLTGKRRVRVDEDVAA